MNGSSPPLFLLVVYVKLFYLLTTVKIYLQGILRLIWNPVVNGKAYQLLTLSGYKWKNCLETFLFIFLDILVSKKYRIKPVTLPKFSDSLKRAFLTGWIYFFSRLCRVYNITRHNSLKSFFKYWGLNYSFRFE